MIAEGRLQVDGDFINQAAQYAEHLLAPLGDRWFHVQGVAQKARQVSIVLRPDDGTCLMAAAYLHDIGDAPSLTKTGFHPLDGAYVVRSLGQHRLASLIAHHSEAPFEGRLRGLESELQEFHRERSALADALTYCDLTTSPTGMPVLFKERVTEVFTRYGETDIVAQALRQAMPYLSLAVARTQRRLYLREYYRY